MINVVIVAIIVLFGLLGVRSIYKHIKGEGGGCCGGGPNTIEEEKVLEGPVIGQYKVEIEGMKCDNCRRRVENSVNKIDGALCKVNLRKNNAVVKFDREVSPDEIKAAIEKLDFAVKGIERE